MVEGCIRKDGMWVVKSENSPRGIIIEFEQWDCKQLHILRHS